MRKGLFKRLPCREIPDYFLNKSVLHSCQIIRNNNRIKFQSALLAFFGINQNLDAALMFATNSYCS